MDTETRQRLESLSQEELLELIDLLHGRDEAMDREIALFASRQAPSAHGQKLRQWIRGLENRHGFVPYRQSFDLAREVEDLAAELRVLIDDGNPTTALEAIDHLLRAGGAILEGTDDSSGAVSGELRETAVLWLRAARQCREAGREADWIGRIGQLMASDEYGLLDEVLPQASILLSEPELRELARRFEAIASSMDSEDSRSFAASTHLGQLAWALRDPSVYVQSIRLRSPEPNELQRASIVECYLNLDDPKGALGWLAGPWARDDARRLDFRARAFEALGQREELIVARREIWDRHPCVATLEDLLSLLPFDEQKKARTEAMTRGASVSGLETALELLIHLEQPAMAEEVLLGRRNELQGDLYTGLQSLVQQFEATGHLLASSLIYRALLDSILNRGYSRAYHHAARYHSHLAKMAGRVKDWRDIESHQAYLKHLWDQHGRKRSFWSRVGGTPK